MTTGWYIEPLLPPDSIHTLPELSMWEKIQSWLCCCPKAIHKEGITLLQTKILDASKQEKTLLAYSKKVDRSSRYSSNASAMIQQALQALLWQHLAVHYWETLAGQPPPERTVQHKHQRCFGLLRWTSETLHTWHKTNEKALFALQKAYISLQQALCFAPKEEKSINWKSEDKNEKHTINSFITWIKESSDLVFSQICRCPFKEEQDLQWCRTTRPGDATSEMEYIEHLSQTKPLSPDQNLHRLYEKERHILDLLDSVEEPSPQKELFIQRAKNRLILIDSLLEVRRVNDQAKGIEEAAKRQGDKDSFFARLFLGRKLYRERLGIRIVPLFPDVKRCLSRLPATWEAAAKLNEDLSPTLLKESKKLWKELEKWKELPGCIGQITQKEFSTLKPKKSV